jgi:hypothetical protein
MNGIFYHCAALGNFGDLFNKWLCEKLTGREFTYAEDMSLFICGSMLGEARQHTKVFGSGFGKLFQKFHGVPTVYTFRGYYSKIQSQALGWQQTHEFIGCFDPMQIIPEWFESKQGSGTGLIRHYIDSELGESGLPEIDICAGIDEVIDFIQQHDEIITSSLHALIAADALGKKTKLVKLSDGIDTDGFKYADYFSVSGYAPYKPMLVGIDKVKDIQCFKRNVKRVGYSETKRYIDELTKILND